MTDIHCVACRYDLAGLSPDSRCPECGTPIHESVAAVNDPRLYRYETRLVARCDRYRRNRAGAIFLGLLGAGAPAAYVFAASIVGTSVTNEFLFALVACLAQVPFWFVVAYGMHARVKHIETIMNYRNVLRANASGAQTDSDAVPCDPA